MNNVMLDIETLDTKSTAVFLSIVAVEFTLDGKMGNEFYHKISLESALSHKRTVGSHTLQWWMTQNKDIRKEMFDGGEELRDVLIMFTTFMMDTVDRYSKDGTNPNAVSIWGNSARFDMGIVENAYQNLGMEVPWDFRNEKCYRTMNSLWPNVERPKQNRESAHHPIHDCKWQIHRLTSIWNWLNQQSVYKDTEFETNYSTAIILLNDVRQRKETNAETRRQINEFLDGGNLPALPSKEKINYSWEPPNKEADGKIEKQKE